MRWTESVVVERPVAVVQAAIADEHELMAWSAWPAGTGYSCRVDRDGVSPGSAIVFTDRRGVSRVGNDWPRSRRSASSTG